MKKMMSISLALLMLVTLAACGNSETPVEKTRLGTSKVFVELPDGFVETEDEFDEDQVAYYYKDDQSIDFDVYQWAKEDTYVLEEEAAYFAAEYGTSATEVTINGIPGMQYISTEEYDGTEYTVINYMFDDGENIVELCFWTVNTVEELAAVDAIIGTLTID